MVSLIEVCIMAKIIIEVYEVDVKMTIRKKYWDADNKVMNANIIKDKIQQGIEVPIEDIDVILK